MNVAIRLEALTVHVVGVLIQPMEENIATVICLKIDCARELLR